MILAIIVIRVKKPLRFCELSIRYGTIHLIYLPPQGL